MTGRVIVLGSVNVDLLARTERLPTPGETVSGTDLTRQLGGKGANQAVAAARADAQSLLLAAVGDDAEGTAMIADLVGAGVDTRMIRRVSAPTGHAIVFTSPRDNQIVVVPGANAFADGLLSEKMNFTGEDVAVTQMETRVGAATAFFERARAAGARTVLNAAPASQEVAPLLPLTDVLIVNESELEHLTGTAINPEDQLAAIENALTAPHLASVTELVVTLGAAGVVIAKDRQIVRIPARRVKVVDTTGAGDCFCGYLAAGLARGSGLEEAALEANVAGSIAVQSLGAASSVPHRAQVLAKLFDQSSMN